jgi:hypothetical protein
MRVFQNCVERRLFGLQKKEKTAVRRELHSEELHNIRSSPKMISVIKPR